MAGELTTRTVRDGSLGSIVVGREAVLCSLRSPARRYFVHTLLRIANPHLSRGEMRGDENVCNRRPKKRVQ